MQIKLPTLFETFALNSAKQHWQNGACVEILLSGVTDSNTVAPSSLTPFTAKVRHKFENVELTVPITAALAGEKSIAPMQQTPAPVSYSYTAPDSEGKNATAQLESRSKRGIAKKDVGFNTKAISKYTGHLTLSMSSVDSSGYKFQSTASANVTFVRSSAGYFVIDPLATSVKTDTLTITESSRTCTMMAGTEVKSVDPAGNLSMRQSGGTKYYFMVSGPRSVTMRCVRNSDGFVYTETVPGVEGFGTWQGTNPMAPTEFQATTDGLLLSGSATVTFTFSTSTSVSTGNNTWFLTGQ